MPETGFSPLARAVAALPELYQPVFGHPEFSPGASRAQDRRLAQVCALHDRLRDHLGRPLRVLDLGCAQGYFSLTLAERGARVDGVDFQSPNLALCRVLAAEHPDFAVAFHQADIAAVLEGVAPGQFDLVLGLSVFHHLVHRDGLEATRRRIGSVCSAT